MLATLISQQIKLKNLSANRLANEVGCSSSTISRYLNGKTEMKFHTMILLVKYLFPERQHEMMETYAREVVIPENLKMALEYASINRIAELSLELIEKQKHMTDSGNDEYADVYTILVNRRLATVTPDEVLTYSKEKQVSSPNMQVLLKIISLYAFYDLGKRELVVEFTEGIHEEIQKLSNEYMRSSFLVRLNEVLSYSSLRIYGDYETAREFSDSVINDKFASQLFIASAYHVNGMSYMYENYDLALNRLEYSAAIYERIGIEQFAKNTREYTIALLNLVHHKLDRVKTSDYVLQAFLSALMNDSKMAIRLLDKKEGHTLCHKALMLYIQGLATQSPAVLYDSLGMYISEGDLWHANLPRLQLLRMGEPSYAVDAVVKYKVKDFKGVENFETYVNRNIISFRANRSRRSS